ncbi:MAG: hypothetical protein ABSF26_11420 [Thermoguttaceae bacterium]
MKLAKLAILFVAVLFLTAFGRAAGPVQHPNLLLNREEIARVKAKIQQHEWAARLFAKVKEVADSNGNNQWGYNAREPALCYVLTAERSYADRVRTQLLNQARSEVPKFEKRDPNGDPFYGFNIWQGQWDAYAWAYDLTYDTFSSEERQLVEHWLRDACKVVIEDYKLLGTTPNLMFVMHFNVGIVAYCLGDRELIDWALNDPGKYGRQCGGFYLRMAKGAVVARGKLTAVRVGATPVGAATTLTLNGQRQSWRRQGAFAQLGEFAGQLPAAAPITAKEDPAEQTASLHSYFLPAEVHLSAVKTGDERAVEMHLRAVGPGKVRGALQVSTRDGVIVTPSRIEIVPLDEGQDRIVRLKVRAAEKAAKGLYPITFVPAAGMIGANP